MGASSPGLPGAEVRLHQEGPARQMHSDLYTAPAIVILRRSLPVTRPEDPKILRMRLGLRSVAFAHECEAYLSKQHWFQRLARHGGNFSS